MTNIERAIMILNETKPCRKIPLDKGWAWVILMASSVILIILQGNSRTFGLFFVELQQNFQTSSSAISIVLGAQWIANCLSSFLALNCLTTILSSRTLIIIGSILSALCFILDSVASNELMLPFFHLLNGAGIAFIYGPCYVNIGHYFKRYRGTANALASCGSSIGQLLFSPLVLFLISEYGINGALLLNSALFLQCIVFAMLLRPISFFEKHSSKEIYLSATFSTELFSGKLDEISKETSSKQHANSERETHENVVMNKFEFNSSSNHRECINRHEHKHEEVRSLLYEVKFHIETDNAKAKKRVEKMQESDLHDKEGGIHLHEKEEGSDLHEKENGIHLHDKEEESVLHEKEGGIHLHEKEESHLHKKEKGIHLYEKEEESDLHEKEEECNLHEKEDGIHLHLHEKEESDLHEKGEECNLHEKEEENHLHGKEKERHLHENEGYMICSQMERNIDTSISSLTEMNEDFIQKKQNSKWWTILSNVDLKLFKEKIYIIYFFAAAIGQNASTLPQTYFPPYAEDIGFGRKGGAFFVAIAGFADFGGRILTTLVADRKFLNRTRFLGLVLFSHGIIGCFIPLYKTFWAFSAYCIYYGASGGILFALLPTVLTDFIGKRRLSQGLGLMYLFNGLLSSFYYPVLGYLRDLTKSYILGYVLNSIALIFSGVLFLSEACVKYKKASENDN